MKMTSIEKVFLDKIVADSGENLDTVRNVLKAVLISVLKEVYATYGNADNKEKIEVEYFIPYIAKLNIACENILTKNDGEKTSIDITSDASIILNKEINRIFSNQHLEIEEFFTQEIALNLLSILDFDRDTIIETS